MHVPYKIFESVIEKNSYSDDAKDVHHNLQRSHNPPYTLRTFSPHNQTKSESKATMHVKQWIKGDSTKSMHIAVFFQKNFVCTVSIYLMPTVRIVIVIQIIQTYVYVLSILDLILPKLFSTNEEPALRAWNQTRPHQVERWSFLLTSQPAYRTEMNKK
jgi:hypothetical protein